MKIYTKRFWQDRKAWKRASYNTMHCLIGCSIGDFGMLIYLQINYPKLALVWMMILPMITGIITSLSLETVVLKLKEKLSWAQSLSTAFNMSIMSMIAMEFSENTMYWNHVPYTYFMYYIYKNVHVRISIMYVIYFILWLRESWPVFFVFIFHKHK